MKRRKVSSYQCQRSRTRLLLPHSQRILAECQHGPARGGEARPRTDTLSGAPRVCSVCAVSALIRREPARLMTGVLCCRCAEGLQCVRCFRADTEGTCQTDDRSSGVYYSIYQQIQGYWGQLTDWASATYDDVIAKAPGWWESASTRVSDWLDTASTKVSDWSTFVSDWVSSWW
ncbi:uncharacterized protein LOC144908532 isoform X1 [Branchiostoma floridae x Branchiostoma belcheri]